MAGQDAATTRKKQRAKRKTSARTKLVLKANPGTFRYRGLMLRPTFVNDERSIRLENAMRDIAMRTSVLAD